MNHFLPGNNGIDQGKLAKAALYLKQLTRKWRADILRLFLLRFAHFGANMGLIVLIAGLLAQLVLKTEHTDFLNKVTAIAVLMLSKTIINYLTDRETGTFTGKISLAVRNTLLKELDNQLESSLINHATGTLALTFSEKTEVLAPYFTRYLPQLLLSVTAPLVLIIYMFTLNWICGLMMVGTLPLIPVYMVLTGKGTSEAARKQWHTLSKMGAYFYDRLKGVTTLFVYGQLSSEIENIDQASGAYGDSAFKVLRIAFLSSAVVEFFSTIIIAGIAIYIGLSLINYIHFGSAGDFTLGESLIILMLVPDFLSALKTLGTYYHDRSMAIGAILHFQEEGFFNRPQTSEHPVNNREKSLKTNSKSMTPPIISIDNLGFWYPGMPFLFRGLTLQVRPGEKLIIKGKNGSGKTTLFSLLLGFTAPVYGKVSLDDTPVEKMCQQEISERISWTGQQPRIFKGTLRYNLLMDHQVDDTTILALIADYFSTDTFFLPFSNGLDTVIADDGRSVSGGERQKIALLRAMIKSAQVILLDEPFTNLDQSATERFMNALLKNNQDKTIILILHDDKFNYEEFKTIRINENMEEYSGVL